MTNNEIRSAVNEIYLQIEQLQEKLKLIRSECSHEQKKKGIYMNNIVTDCLVCEICDESFFQN